MIIITPKVAQSSIIIDQNLNHNINLIVCHILKTPMTILNCIVMKLLDPASVQ